MQLENLKVEINPIFKKQFLKYYPNKKESMNRIDFYSIHDFMLKPNERRIVPLELKLSVDENHVFIIYDNEEIAQRNGVLTLNKVITSQDRDFITLTLWNTTPSVFNVRVGDVIACGYLISSPLNYTTQMVKKI